MKTSHRISALSLLALVATTLSPAVAPARADCPPNGEEFARSLFRPAGGTYETRKLATVWKDPDTATLMNLLDEPVVPKLREELTARWDAIEDEAESFVDFLSTPREKRSAKDRQILEAIQNRLMSPSRTATGQNVYEKAIERSRRNWKSAYAEVEKWVADGSDLTEARLLELNRVLGYGLDFNEHPPGVWRTIELGIGRTPEGDLSQLVMAHEDVPQAIRLFFTWYAENQGRLHPIELAAQVSRRLNAIHPFNDANGRTSRLVADWILLRNGYPPIVYSDAKAAELTVFAHDPMKTNQTLDQVLRNATDAIESGIELYRTETAKPFRPTRFQKFFFGNGSL